MTHTDWIILAAFTVLTVWNLRKPVERWQHKRDLEEWQKERMNWNRERLMKGIREDEQ